MDQCERDAMMIETREGCTYVCTVPHELGAVVKMEIKRGSVIARTESGMTMIIPVREVRPSDA